jgi:hypothetical protein
MDTNAKTNKDSLVSQIGNMKYCGRTMPEAEREDKLLFWMDEDDKCPQFQSKFCKKCGNYWAFNTRPENRKILCRC